MRIHDQKGTIKSETSTLVKPRTKAKTDQKKGNSTSGLRNLAKMPYIHVKGDVEWDEVDFEMHEAGGAASTKSEGERLGGKRSQDAGETWAKTQAGR